MIKLDYNAAVRKQMNQFIKDNFSPSLKVIAKEISINYTMFADWYRGDRNVGDATLKKIEKFLRNHTK
ncbi:hypothetical protein [Macrococcus carouselicus]|uniref:Uncharacterized protein n=1 Tax=Macrococcus carouselicus TaxID=69969 RepID=A0A9Q8CNU8_9STAP|nr:hypothetical protein [Macrococcus carouselicus]TDM04050.1 hypothetical protein ERX40_02455 [Macrococcus carouselicus]